jgi:integrase
VIGKAERGLLMKHAKIIEFPRSRKKKAKEKDRGVNSGKKGRVYGRAGMLWVDFRYLGNRVREPSGLKDTPTHRDSVRKQLDLVIAEIENGIFEFAKRFPHSKKRDYFTILEGRKSIKDPREVLFGEYVKKWWKEMKPGMSYSQTKDYTTILKTHHLPYFGNMHFRDICSRVLIKKFVASLKSKKNRYGQPLSPKRIQNVMIPLRVIVRDAVDEYDWSELPDPFTGLKLPKVRKIRICPFGFQEWKVLISHMLPWYRPYFEFAVQTGLRPSEQVALKWSAIDDEYVHIELSRVYSREKTDLKTEESRRRIRIRPGIQKWLDKQRKLIAEFNSPYVFVNTQGRPILQDKLREVWARVMKKTALPYRRMYETRHTFASWALAAGETPEWVARTLGHVDTSMVYKTYGRYIPNLTRQDGSAFEKQYQESVNAKRQPK